MKNISLTNSILFKGFNDIEIDSILKCLNVFSKKFEKSEIVYKSGNSVNEIGLVLLGGLNIENDDIWGNKSILEHINPGQIFAEAYACTNGEPLLVNVVASEHSEILFLNINKILQVCPNSCVHHNKLIKNLLTIIAQKNLNLSRRILYTSSKTIQGRLLSYFSHQALEMGSLKFTIPFNRQQLADYLGVDRSALSNQLSKMKEEGIISYNKNTFILNEVNYNISY